MDPVLLDISQPGCSHGPGATVWLQHEPMQAVLAAPQASAAPQPLDPGMWALPTHGPQVLQSDAPVLVNGVSVLQDSSCQGAAQLHQGISATIDGVPVVLQVQSSAAGLGLQQPQLLPPVSLDAGLQPLQQQVYVIPAPEQQVLSAGSTQVSLQQVHAHPVPQQWQQQVLATTSAPSAGAGADPSVRLQLQQLQDAVQQLSSQTAVVQHVLATRVSQPQVPQPAQPNLEGMVPPASMPCATHATPGQLAVSTPASGSTSGRHSSSGSSSSWHDLDAMCSNSSSSSSYGLQHGSTLGHVPLAASSVAAAAGGGGAQGSSVLRIISGPSVPQPAQQSLLQPNMPGQGLHSGLPDTSVSFSQAQVQAGGACGPGAVALGSSWPGDACMVPAAGGGSCSTMGHARSSTYARVGYSHGPQTAQRQPGRIDSRDSSFVRQQQQQGPFRGSRAFNKGGIPFQAPAGGGVQPHRPAAQGRPAARSVGRVVEGTALASSSSPVPSSGPSIPAPWAHISLEEGLQQLWGADALQRARGGRMFNVQQLAWHPVGEPAPSAQDLYNFQMLKRIVQKLDAVHKTRIKLIKRMHIVAERGGCDLKALYREGDAPLWCRVGGRTADGVPIFVQNADLCRLSN